MRSPAREEHVLVPDARCRGKRVLPFPFAGVAADQHQRRGRAQPLVRAGVGGDQERQPLHSREATDVEQDRRSSLEGGEVLLGVGDASGAAAHVPTERLIDKPAPPEAETVCFGQWPAREPGEIDAARQATQPPALEAEQQRRLRLGPRRHDHELALLSPAAQPLRPAGGVAPTCWRPGLDQAQESKLGPMQLAEDRQRRKAADRRLVRRSQMVKMKQIGLAGIGAHERLAPSSDQPLVGHVVDTREDTVGRARAILIGGLEGKQSGERISKLERGRVIDRVHLKATEEAPRIRLVSLPPERTGGEPRLPTRGRKRTGKRTRDLRRPATREEEQHHEDTLPLPHQRAKPTPHNTRRTPVCARPLHKQETLTSDEPSLFRQRGTQQLLM